LGNIIQIDIVTLYSNMKIISKNYLLIILFLILLPFVTLFVFFQYVVGFFYFFIFLFLIFYKLFFKKFYVVTLNINEFIKTPLFTYLYMFIIYIPKAWAYNYNYNLLSFFLKKKVKSNYNVFSIFLSILLKFFVKLVSGFPFFAVLVCSEITVYIKDLLEFKNEGINSIFVNFIATLSYRYSNSIIYQTNDTKIILEPIYIIKLNPFDNFWDFDNLSDTSDNLQLKQFQKSLNSLKDLDFFIKSHGSFALNYSSINGVNYHYSIIYNVNVVGEKPICFGTMITSQLFLKNIETNELIPNNFERKPNLLGDNEKSNYTTVPQLWYKENMILKNSKLESTPSSFIKVQKQISDSNKSIILNITNNCYDREEFGIKKNLNYESNKDFLIKNYSNLNDILKFKFEKLINFVNNNPNCFNKNLPDRVLFSKFLKKK